MRMKFVISAGLGALVVSALSLAAVAASPLREAMLRQAAIDAGLVPLTDIIVPQDPELSAIGGKLFESTLLSLNSDTSCQTCHLDEFGSADGLPNAVGTGGLGEGLERMQSDGDIVPRNTLPLWNRGTLGFDTFFGDGKVMSEEGQIISQFGDKPPSLDPLVVSVHLPFVEIREMVSRTDQVASDLELEDVTAATAVFGVLAGRVRADQALGAELAKAHGKTRDDIAFEDIATAIAAFIRDDFAVESTAFHEFVFAQGNLSDEEIAGGLLFYGKGQCSSCHSGPLMSDLDFHVIPMPQAGFGKNGFGVDLGRYNTTRRASDKYRFRTPPLINVTKTAPYGHSGSLKSLRDAVSAHVDPLKNYNGASRTPTQRREDIQRLQLWSASDVEALSDPEVDALVAFLKTLESNP